MSLILKYSVVSGNKVDVSCEGSWWSFVGDYDSVEGWELQSNLIGVLVSGCPWNLWHTRHLFLVSEVVVFGGQLINLIVFNCSLEFAAAS